jgi:hypothetical protein
MKSEREYGSDSPLGLESKLVSELASGWSWALESVLAWGLASGWVLEPSLGNRH